MSQAGTHSDPAYKRDAIGLRFYLMDVVQRSAAAAENEAAFLTNYLWLVTRIHDVCGPEVAYVSFNYDTMLESAINSRFGASIGKDLSSYMSGPVRVFKPHGSVNWTQAIPALGPPPPNSGYFYMHPTLADVAAHADFDSSGPVEIFKPEDVGGGRDAFFVPAVAVPVADKDAFVMPEDHLGEMIGALRQTTRILTIGWRGSELKFQETARQYLPSEALPAMIVTKGTDRSAADETITNLGSNLDAGATEVLLDGFTGFAQTDALHSFAGGTSS